MENFEILYNDTELNSIIDSIDEVNRDFLLAGHGRYHTMFVVNTVENILSNLNYDKNIVELGKISGLLHDIGTINGKKGHALLSSEMCMHFLDKTKLSLEDKNTIKHAIKDHSNGDDIKGPIGAVLLFADKIDMSRERVLELGKKDRWHSNWLNIEKINVYIKDKNIIVDYIANDKFSKDIWFEELDKGILMPIKASKYLGYNCAFEINGIQFDLTEIVNK